MGLCRVHKDCMQRTTKSIELCLAVWVGCKDYGGRGAEF